MLLATAVLSVLTTGLHAATPPGQRVKASSQASGKNLYRALINPPLMIKTKDCIEIVVVQDVILDREGMKLWFWVGTPDQTFCTIVSITRAQ